MTHARGLVLAHRMPPAPKTPTGNPFTALGDVVLDCDVPGCGWHAQCERAVAKAALDDHRRFWHLEQTLIVRLNDPRGRL